MLARLLYLPVMLVGGLHFCLIGTVVGLIAFLTLLGMASGRPDFALQVLANEPLQPFYLAAIYGGPPAFVTGLIAGPLRLAMRSHLCFVAAMAPIGLIATAIYLMLLGSVFEAGLMMVSGGLAALCCAIPFGFWLQAERPGHAPLTRRQSVRRYLSPSRASITTK